MVLCSAPDNRGATWGPDDTIVFAQNSGGGLLQVSASGGTPKDLTQLDSAKGESSHRWPEFLPGGKAVVFAAGVNSANFTDNSLAIVRLDTGKRHDLFRGAGNPRYVSSGHIVYVQRGTLMAVPFDAGRLEVSGSPSPVGGTVLQNIVTGAAQYAVSSRGWLAYAPGSPLGPSTRLVFVDRKGAVEALKAPAQNYGDPHLSPEGKRVAVTIIGAKNDIWSYDLIRDTLTRLTFEAINYYPIWTPDGRRITYRFTKSGPQNIFWKPADGSGTEERLATSQYNQVPTSWSSDGKMLAFYESNPKTGWDIWILATEGDRKARPLLVTPFDEGAAVFSPDNRWLAYVSNESGRQEVYVRPVFGSGEKWQISTEGGTEPVWAHSGRELFYRSGAKMMAVDVGTDAAFAAGKLRLLFEGQFRVGPTAGRAGYDVTSDGQRFLMIQESGAESAPRQLEVVQEWFSELKRGVPVGAK